MELTKNVEIKAERPYTFYAKINNYNLQKGDKVGIFEKNNLIGKFEYTENKENGAISINIFPKNRYNKTIKLVVYSKNFNEIFFIKVNFEDKDSNFQSIPVINLSKNSVAEIIPKESKNISISEIMHDTKLYTIPSELSFKYLN